MSRLSLLMLIAASLAGCSVQDTRQMAENIRVRAEGFGRAELHDMREADGMMRMRPLAPLELAPAGRLALQPGGAHLMLMQPAAIPAAGTRVMVEFELADGRRVAVPFEVRAPQR